MVVQRLADAWSGSDGQLDFNTKTSAALQQACKARHGSRADVRSLAVRSSEWTDVGGCRAGETADARSCLCLGCCLCLVYGTGPELGLPDRPPTPCELFFFNLRPPLQLSHRVRRVLNPPWPTRARQVVHAEIKRPLACRMLPGNCLCGAARVWVVAAIVYPGAGYTNNDTAAQRCHSRTKDSVRSQHR